MKEKIDQLENLLKDIKELIEQRIEIEQIDLEEFDNLQKNDRWKKEYVDDFRETILSYKNDHSFYENDIPRLEVLLSDALRQLRAIRNESLEIKLYGNRNKPNPGIIKLIKQRILNTKSPIRGEMHGKVVSGILTKDGYLELNVNGSSKKFGSLRRAAIEVWGRDIQSQWKFWKAKVDIDEEEKPLEYFKNLIDK